jgi:hypothetical protein
MKTAIAFLTKFPHVDLIKFAEEVESIGFDVFIVSDDFCESKNIVYIDDIVCLWQGYVNAHIWENSPSIKKQITAWDKMLYLFCEDETKYDFVWVFEDDVFIPSVETIQFLQMKYKNSHLVVPNNFKNDGSQMDWHWRWIYDKCTKGPYAYSMVSGCGLSRDILNEVKRFKECEKQLFFIEAMFNTLALQKGLKVAEAPELKSIVWQGEWGIDEFLLLPNNVFHPVKDISSHYSLREKIKQFRYSEYKPINKLPSFLIS